LALWSILNKVWDAFGEKNFQDILPKPPAPDSSKDPKTEWALMLKGDSDEVKVNPLDDDLLHLQDHRKRLAEEMQEPVDRRNRQLEEIAAQHIIDHEKQRRQKQLLQAAFQSAMAAHQAQQNGGMGPAIPQGPGFQGPNALPFPGGAAPGGGGDVGAAAAVAGPAGVGAPQ
jgi:hypothetical protein